MFETIKSNALTIMTGKFLLLAFAISSHTACTKSFEGEYSDPDKVEIIDDKWNETDAKKTAKHMIAGMLEKPWLGNFTSSHGNKPPFVIVDETN